ncbi:hypothetical protein [Gimesia sp.]|uniref:hypothetical protein n=1 Tax=Gimesia sp. TaxID=2024833 RepID=UPI0032EC6CE9
MFTRLLLAKYHHARRWIGLFVLISIVSSLVPLPLSLSSPVEKDLSTPFPCQNRPCGCQSAKQCWKSCCCFTNREKIVWAKANRVEAPAYVAQAAKKESRETACSSGSCCSEKKQHAADLPVLNENHPGCCTSAKAVTTQSEKTAASNTDNGPVIGLYAQKCQGQGTFWNSLPWAIVPGLQAEVLVFAPDIWNPFYSVKAPEKALEPPTPPPRIV